MDAEFLQPRPRLASGPGPLAVVARLPGGAQSEPANLVGREPSRAGGSAREKKSQEEAQEMRF